MAWLRRWAFNRADFMLGVFIATGLSALALWITISSHVKGDSAAAALIAAIGALTLTAIAGIVKITSTRQSLTSLITSEVRAIQYGLSTMDMFDFWAQLHAHPEFGGLGFADTPREEDYFQLFHSVAQNVGNLHPRAVEAIVRFYSYLKMSRDAAASLHSWRELTEPELRRMHVEYVIRLLALSMLWGFVALWCMGSLCQRQDRQLLEKIRTAYDQTIGGNFDDFFYDHPRIQFLERFFRLRRTNQAASD